MTGLGCIVLDTSQDVKWGNWGDELQERFVEGLWALVRGGLFSMRGLLGDRGRRGAHPRYP